MLKPIVAVIGRPNVGKSTFFNAIIGERISIVDDTPGITRDRIYADTEWLGQEITFIDTGGIEPDTSDNILAAMRNQAEIAIDTADVIIFMCDLKTGLLPADYEIATMLRKSDKPIILVVNKSDNPANLPPEIYEFYQLGLGDFIPISASHRLGFTEVLDRVLAELPEQTTVEQDEQRIAVAVIGKPNVGKSSLINYFLQEERTIVSDQAGTTRDAIDVFFEHPTGSYRLIDTAGLRRKSRIKDKIEKYSNLRTEAAVKRSDVCLIMIDALDGITEQDTKVAGLAHNNGKAAIFVINKWDLIENKQELMSEIMADIKQRFNFMSYAPLIFVSAKTGQRIDKIFNLITEVYQEANKRLSTTVINEVLAEATAMNPTPQDKGRRLKILYATQVAVGPPQFVFFVNNKDLLHFSYERYLENQFRLNFGFEGTPIFFIWRNRKRNEELTDIFRQRD
ncbi:MAG TPA: ribosome biogenesis GTPase Der [Clostridiaceae bacterium]|jgi:GTP-binding protein|nr:ribosome biogenesis GTPase Der [Clostridiaceae bacterium]